MTVTMQIIEKIDSHNNTAVTILNPALVEPVFLSDTMLAAFLKSKSADTIINFMAQKIARSPTDLQLHLKRIDFCSQQDNHSGIYGALLDLFTVLQEKGRPLRKRLLQKYSAQLESEQRSILYECLSGKPDNERVIPFSKESMLSDGRTGTLKLLSKQKLVNRIQPRDVVEDARELINFGQVGKATVLLKKALLVNPEREDIGRELMIIYHHSHNYSAVEKILQSTKRLPLALRAQWNELAVCLKNDVREAYVK